MVCSVPEFEASQYLVTNREFLEFVESGGYQNKDLWTQEGMANISLHAGRSVTVIFWIGSETIVVLLPHSLGCKWVEYRCVRHPTFWVCSEVCKSGCGADLASYSHCNLLPPSSANGTHNNKKRETKYKYLI